MRRGRFAAVAGARAAPEQVAEAGRPGAHRFDPQPPVAELVLVRQALQCGDGGMTAGEQSMGLSRIGSVDILDADPVSRHNRAQSLVAAKLPVEQRLGLLDQPRFQQLRPDVTGSTDAGKPVGPADKPCSSGARRWSSTRRRMSTLLPMYSAAPASSWKVYTPGNRGSDAALDTRSRWRTLRMEDIGQQGSASRQRTAGAFLNDSWSMIAVASHSQSVRQPIVFFRPWIPALRSQIRCPSPGIPAGCRAADVGTWWNGRSVANIVPHAVLGFRVCLDARRVPKAKIVAAANARQAKRYAERWCAARLCPQLRLRDAVARLVDPGSPQPAALTREQRQRARRLAEAGVGEMSRIKQALAQGKSRAISGFVAPSGLSSHPICS